MKEIVIIFIVGAVFITLMNVMFAYASTSNHYRITDKNGNCVKYVTYVTPEDVLEFDCNEEIDG